MTEKEKVESFEEWYNTIGFRLQNKHHCSLQAWDYQKQTIDSLQSQLDEADKYIISCSKVTFGKGLQAMARAYLEKYKQEGEK